MEDSTQKSAEAAPTSVSKESVTQSDFSSSKERARSSGSLNSVDGFPSQISYNSNGSFRNHPPPPLTSPHNGQNSPFDPVMPAGYPPPPHMHAYQMSSSPVILTTGQPPPAGMGPYPPAGVNYPVQMLNPGNGLPPPSPAMHDMNGGSNHGSSRNRGYRRDPHRRSNSYNGPGSYGSMDNSAQAFFSPTGAPPLGPRRTTNKKRTGSADFSPVAEVRKLTGSSGGSIRPPVSPSTRSVHSHNRAKSADWQGAPGLPMMHQPPPSPIPGSPMVYNRGVYMGGDLGDDLLHNMNVNGMTGSIRSLSDRKLSEDDGSDAGGEAVFLLNKSSRQKSSRRKSTKKRHMRQRSAQLYMEEVKGVEQMPKCRDIGFVLIFVFHLLVIINLGMTYGNEALKFHDHSPEESEESITIIFENLIYISGLSGVFAMVVSGLTLLLMTSIAHKIVQIALILSITFSFVWGTMGIGLSPDNIVPITGIIALTLSVAYAFIVWDRIPFAAANLHAGLSGILANPGAVFVSFVFQVLALGWSVYYIFVAGGIYDAFQLGEIAFYDSPAAQYIYFGLLAASYYWTLNVFLNIVQVTVADVIGKWWYTVDGDSSSRGADLNHAFFRSSFYSIGSICYGSLFVGPVKVLRQLSVFFRPADELNSLLTLHECMHCIQSALTNCVESLARRFSPWSFTYVGLYGYNTTDAGLRAAELFEKRGWSTIVSDELVPNVLLLITLTITGLTGIFAHVLEQFESLSLTATKEELVTPFIIGALVGLVVSSVLFGIISSSVNAVIVLFATSPVDFEENHPELSEEMRSAWREVWPGCMDIMGGAFMDPALNASLTGASINGSLRGLSPAADMYATYNPALSSSVRSQSSERHPLLR